jgi:hypothetical protein
MSAELALEGTWEEILDYASSLEGRRVRLIVLSNDTEPYPGVAPDKRPSTGASLLKFAGTWEGDDLPEVLELMRQTRSLAKF